MGLVSLLALVLWLAIPAIRIWRDPELRRHTHVYRSDTSGKKLTWVNELPTPPRRIRTSCSMLSVDHRSTFWERYRSMLSGVGWPPDDRSPACRIVRDVFGPDQPKVEGPVDSTIEADHVSISL